MMLMTLKMTMMTTTTTMTMMMMALLSNLTGIEELVDRTRFVNELT